MSVNHSFVRCCETCNLNSIKNRNRILEYNRSSFMQASRYLHLRQYLFYATFGVKPTVESNIICFQSVQKLKTLYDLFARNYFVNLGRIVLYCFVNLCDGADDIAHNELIDLHSKLFSIRYVAIESRLIFIQKKIIIVPRYSNERFNIKVHSLTKQFNVIFK